jgi:MATE family multidrug resistance protein
VKNRNQLQIWRLAGPLILSNISIALLGIVDTAVVGHLSHPYYLGAVAVSAVVFDFLYWGMGFLRMGTTGIVAQVHGRRDHDQIRSTLVHSIFIALSISLLMLIMQNPIANAAFFLIGGSEQVLLHARIYFTWAIWGAPAVLCSMAMFGWLLGMQNAKASLYFAITINVINIILDLIFVFGFDMEVKGVALASVIAQYTGLTMGIFLVRSELRNYPGHWRYEFIMDVRRLLRMLSLNKDIFIRTICLIFVFAFFARQGALQGDVILAANAVLLNFQALTALGLDGFANATEALVGKAIGAENRLAFKQSVRGALLWSLIIATIFTLTYWLAGDQVIGLVTSIPEVYDMAVIYLPWLIISPLLCVWCFLLDGIFIGAVRGLEMRNSMLLSTFVVFMPVWYLFRFLGNHGLWLALLVFFVARGVSLGWYYIKIERWEGGFVMAKQSPG